MYTNKIDFYELLDMVKKDNVLNDKRINYSSITGRLMEYLRYAQDLNSVVGALIKAFMDDEWWKYNNNIVPEEMVKLAKKIYVLYFI